MEKQAIKTAEAIKKIESYLSAIYFGYEAEVIDPLQAQVLLAFLQAKSLETAIKITEKYALLGELTEKYTDLMMKIREELENEYDLVKMNEKKVENLCLQKSEELRKLKNEKEKLKLQIKALTNEVKHYGYLSQVWREVIQKITLEWKNS